MLTVRVVVVGVWGGGRGAGVPVIPGGMTRPPERGTEVPVILVVVVFVVVVVVGAAVVVVADVGANVVSVRVDVNVRVIARAGILRGRGLWGILWCACGKGNLRK